MPGKRQDLIGQRFGRLVVVGYSHTDANRNSLWHCRCDCGSTSVVYRGGLKSGRTQSCGCLHREMVGRLAVTSLTKHGMSAGHVRTPTYSAWLSARQRCNSEVDPYYANYGGRGIEMRFASVLDLIADIGEKPDTPGLSLDRIDNDGHYESGNVRWATAKQQANNRRQPVRKGR
jgi:hypothetical protein